MYVLYVKVSNNNREEFFIFSTTESIVDAQVIISCLSNAEDAEDLKLRGELLHHTTTGNKWRQRHDIQVADNAITCWVHELHPNKVCLVCGGVMVELTADGLMVDSVTGRCFQDLYDVNDAGCPEYAIFKRDVPYFYGDTGGILGEFGDAELHDIYKRIVGAQKDNSLVIDEIDIDDVSDDEMTPLVSGLRKRNVK